MNDSNTTPSSNTTSSNVVFKAGLWYTISNFIFRGMAFISTPLFTRLLTRGEYGEFSNFASWMSILAIITGCDLQTSIIRSKLEFNDDIDNYVSSILSLTTIITALWYIIGLSFDDFIFNSILGIDKKYIHIMFFYLFLIPAFNMYVTKSRAFYKYKKFTIMTGISLVVSTVSSIFLVMTMEDKLLGRIIGQYMPVAIISLCIYINIILSGKKINFSYWKYAITMCIPLVPHLLSMNILSSSDRIIITRISGADYTAIYSVAYSCAHIVSILLDSMNKAWAPWFLDSLHAKDYSKIKKVTTPYFLLFVVMATGIILLAPEITLILGGTSYYDAIYVIPPLIVGCVFQFAYTMYVQIEFYKKKTIGVAIGTMLAATINIGLNLIFIPMYGYLAAAYTTLLGYICLLFFHYLVISRWGYKDIFDRKLLFGGLLVEIILMCIIVVIYDFNMIRWAIILLYSLVAFLILLHKKDVILKLFKK